MRRVVWTLLLAVAMLAMGATSVLAADPTTIASAMMVFEGPLSDDGDGSYTGIVPMVQESVAGGGDGVDGFDVYARNGAMATYDKAGAGQDYACGAVVEHDAYTTAGGWGSFYDPDCADWQHYQLRLDGDMWYLEYVSGGTAHAPPMSGEMTWDSMYAAETGVGAYYTPGPAESAGYALNNLCTGVNDGTAAWDMDWSWGSEYIPLAFPGFELEVSELGGGNYRVVMTPASGPSGHGAPGPVKNVTTGESFGTIQAAVDAASAGHVLEAVAGVYAENVVIDTDLALSGAGRDATVVDAGGSGTPLRVQGATVQLSDLGVANAEMSATEGGLVLIYAPGSTLDQVRAVDCPVGIAVVGSSGVSITDSEVDHCGWGVVVDNDEVVGGDKSVVSDNLLVDGCTFVENAEAGLYIAENCHSATITDSAMGGNGGAGVYVWKSSGHTMTGNTLCANLGEGVHLFGSQDCVVTDNEIADNEIGIKVRSGVIDSVGNAFNWNTISGNATWGAVATENSGNVVDCAFNYWGAEDGPSGEGPGSGDAVSIDIDFDPFAKDFEWKLIMVFPTDTKEQIQKAIDESPAGGTIIFQGPGVFPGGLDISRPDITIEGQDGAVIPPGSPAFTVTASNVVIKGLELDGTGGSPASAGIVVDGGANNCSIVECNIHDWEDGVKITSANTSFKMVGNWLHNNTFAGLRVNPGSLPGGVVTIEGNLFIANCGDGIVNEDTSGVLAAEYNAWGCLGGPNGARGDGVDLAHVDAEPFTYAELYMDMQPAEPTEETSVSVAEDDVFEVQLKVDAAELTGLQFRLIYDTDFLVLQSATWENGFGAHAKNLEATPVDGQEFFSTWLLSPVNGQDIAVMTLEFAATDADGSWDGDDGPWTQYFDIIHEESETNAGAFGGVKIFVDNAGFGAPSDPSRDIAETTDPDDGAVVINGIANYTGFVDLQGRTDDTGADVSVTQSTVLMATGGSLSDGSFETAHEPGQKLVIGQYYDIVVDGPLFLPASLSAEILDERPLDGLPMVKLLGGDATDDDQIDIGDVSLIGGEYGKTSSFNPNADVNIDARVDILDLVLAAGNYGLSASPW